MIWLVWRSMTIVLGLASRLGGAEHLAGGAEEVGGLAGFGDDADGLGEGFDAIVDAAERGVEAGEDEDGTGGVEVAELGHEGDAVAARHVDVGEQEVGGEVGGGEQSLVGSVDGGDLEALAGEDETEGLGYERFVVDYEDAHGGSPGGAYAGR